jgi:16S rRNA (guanine966-N2)-methyltransferase
VKRPPGHVRIIAGSLRGSKLPVAERPGLRPTSDRARETLFNWLQQEVAGRNVLDLFAGSGALGFEAASRGAGDVVLVERDAQLAASLRDSAQRLQAGQVRVECADALAWLARSPDRAFDLVFLDPPFGAGLLAAVAQPRAPWLAPQAWVYVEHGAEAAFLPPPGWRLHREGGTREARHRLFRVERAGAGTLEDSPTEAGIQPP